MFLLLIMVLSVIGFGYAVYYSFFSTPDFNAVGKNTVVTLVKIIPDKNGVKGDYTFNCNGEIRTVGGGGVIWGAICGDKYEALYDSSNCRHVKILFYRPVFSDTEIVGVTTGEIYQVGPPFIFKPFVKFKYSVGERMYERFQNLEKYPEVKKGAKFPVKYWVENPKRSIIYIEKNK